MNEIANTETVIDTNNFKHSLVKLALGALAGYFAGKLVEKVYDDVATRIATRDTITES